MYEVNFDRNREWDEETGPGKDCTSKNVEKFLPKDIDIKLKIWYNYIRSAGYRAIN